MVYTKWYIPNRGYTPDSVYTQNSVIREEEKGVYTILCDRWGIVSFLRQNARGIFSELRRREDDKEEMDRWR